MEGIGDHISSLNTVNIDADTESSERIREIALQEQRAIESEGASAAVVSGDQNTNKADSTVKK